MTVKTLEDLFHETLKDLYYAEKKLVKTLPKMAKLATPPLSRKPLSIISKRPKAMSRGWRKFSPMQASKPASKKCEAVEGLVKEAEEVLGRD